MRNNTRFDKFFQNAALMFESRGIEYNWLRLKAQGMAESNLKPEAISHCGAIGIMQIMPATGKELGYTEKELLDPEKSIQAGATYMIKMLEMWKRKIPYSSERWCFALASYNAGAGNIRRARRRAIINGWESLDWGAVSQELRNVTGKHSKETINYVARIKRFYRELRKM
jgi:membrane-bound lytic murein transglycosylase F